MQEIAQQFKEELQELLNRYKNKIPVSCLMNITQNVFHKTLSIKYHPELHNFTEEHSKQIVSSGPSFLEQHAIQCADFKYVGEDTLELPNIPAWIVEQMTESEKAAFAKWYNKVRNEIEANKLGDTLKNG